MLSNLTYNIFIAWEAILQNKLRAVLTSLGIICGVASVIAMLAIGKGAEQEILEKMKLLGTNNIIITPKIKKDKAKSEQESDEEKKEKNKYSPGLTLKDAESIERIIPGISQVSPEIVIESVALREGFKRNVKLVGITPSFFELNQFNLISGSDFLVNNIQNAEPVCIIGYGVKTKLFAGNNAIGKYIKVSKEWLKVVAVLEEKFISKENLKNLNIRDFNYDVYIPATTMLMRFRNRALVTKQSLHINQDEEASKDDNNNQLDRLVVGVQNSELSSQTAEIISRLLKRKHNYLNDFEVTVPELLLQQEQRTKNIFNIVLGAIASISLLVGGIGIMNIMLASVLERTKEIGIRRAIGAKQRDIMLQFLCEAVAISISGGIIGIIIGISMSFGIEKFTDIKTIVSPFSVILSFFVSISVGLLFGIAPARKASQEDPINLLRYE